MLLLVGWFVVPEVQFAPAVQQAPGKVLPTPAVNYGRAG
jgi:hypothetical protein